MTAVDHSSGPDGGPDEASGPLHGHARSPMRPYSDVEYVFEPHTPSLGSTRQYLQDVWDRRRFAIALAKSELRGPRANTVLGEVWGVMDPLFMAAIYWFLVTVIRGSGSNSTKLMTLIMSGIFLFTFTASVIGEGGRSITRNKGLMLNSTFPRALLPIATIYKALMAFVPAIGIYAIVHLLLRAPLGAGLFVLPFLFLLQLLISAGLGLIFATLTVYIRDMTNVLDYVMRVLLFATPVIYPTSQLPAGLRAILRLNPLFSVFSAYQSVIGGGLPAVSDVAISVFWAVVLIVAGFRIFVAHERGFAMRL